MFKTKVAEVRVLNLAGGFFYGFLFCLLFGFMFLIYHVNSPHTPLFLASLIFYFLCIVFMEIALVGELGILQQQQLDQLKNEVERLKEEIRRQKQQP